MAKLRRRTNDSGAAAVELALILPIFVMLAFGIIAFGLGYNQQLVVTRAAREAARTMAVTDSVASARAAAFNAADSLDPGSLSISLTSCGPTPDLDDVATADISYPYAYEIPFVGSYNVTLQGRATMHCGG
ncbi:MAG: pilus assembly protein [Actinobacteria bacterium]|nr:pilus assembly protein [Actinomycetota bacterium]